MKNNHLTNFLFLLLLFFFSCKENKSPEKSYNNSIKSEPLVSQKKVIDSKNDIIITGKSDDKKALEYFNLLDFNTREKPKWTKQVIGDSLHLVLHGFTEGQLLELIAFSDTDNRYWDQIFVTPGDTISMAIKDGELSFNGKNAVHYNYYSQIKELDHQNWAVYKGDLNKYKKETVEAYESKIAAFDQYLRNHPEVSDEFRLKVKTDLKYEFLYNLMLPRDHKNALGDYQSNFNGIGDILAKEYNPQSSEVFDARSYFDTIAIDDFQDNALVTVDYYKRALQYYIRYYLANLESLEYSASNFMKERKYIEENLDGELRNYALNMMMIAYFEKGLGNGPDGKEVILATAKKYKNEIQGLKQYERLEEYLVDLKMNDFTLPDNVGTDKVVNKNGDTLELAKVLASRKIKVLDFWASWCGPCIAEFEKENDFKNKLQQEEGLSFIYLSIDEDNTKWLKSVNRYKTQLNSDEQYRFVDMKKSKLLKYLLIRDQGFSIPRYSVLSKENTIISANAPRPSDTTSFKKVIASIVE